MTDHIAEVQALIARDKITRCIVSLARGEDRRDPRLITAAFWPDAQVDFGIFAGDFDAYLAWVVPGSDAVPVTQHVLGQSHIELAADGARAETHVVSYHRIDMGTEHRDVVLGGRYLDRLEVRVGEWRIAERTMLYDWHQDWGQAVDWSQGLMGMRFSADHYTGRASGDHSEAFFKGAGRGA